MNDNNENESTQWHEAASSGYTPLADLDYSKLSSILYSARPSDSDDGSADDSGDGNGIFFVDLKAFGPSDDCNDDEPKEYAQVDVTAKKKEEDFRMLADQALMALDDEYRATISAGVTTQAQSDALSKEPVNTGIVEEDACNSSLLLQEGFGIDNFSADFETETDTSESSPSKLIPDIDTDAVRRAIQAIESRDSRFCSNYAQWQARQNMLVASVAPKMHPIIPAGPLSAFSRSSKKAIHATSVLSRAATIAEALLRLDLLRSTPFNSNSTHDDTTSFRIDIVGCDFVECSSTDRIVQLFAPLTRWMGAYVECPNRLLINLVGPNIPETAPRRIDLLCPQRHNITNQSNQQSDTFSNVPEQQRCGQLLSAYAACHCVEYQDFYETMSADADLIVAFHAGMWGYREWQTLLQKMLARRSSESCPTDNNILKQKQYSPFVVTAYTIQEAEDDAEVIQQAFMEAGRTKEEMEAAIVWEPELNAYASKVDRATVSAPPGRRYRENSAWQAWRI